MSLDKAIKYGKEHRKQYKKKGGVNYIPLLVVIMVLAHIVNQIEDIKNLEKKQNIIKTKKTI